MRGCLERRRGDSNASSGYCVNRQGERRQTGVAGTCAGEPPTDSAIEWSPVRSIAAAAAEDQQQLASQAANELRMRSLQVRHDY